jgi:hypothetical protein
MSTLHAGSVKFAPSNLSAIEYLESVLHARKAHPLYLYRTVSIEGKEARYVQIDRMLRNGWSYNDHTEKGEWTGYMRDLMMPRLKLLDMDFDERYQIALRVANHREVCPFMEYKTVTWAIVLPLALPESKSIPELLTHLIIDINKSERHPHPWELNPYSIEGSEKPVTFFLTDTEIEFRLRRRRMFFS